MSLPPISAESFEEMLALNSGESLAEYRRSAEQQRMLRQQADAYYDLPATEWPPLIFNWDLAPESQHFALDGVKPSAFLEQYPEGVILGRTTVAAFDAKLCHFSRRDGPEELWALGFKSSLAYMIAYLANGLPITPPLVAPHAEAELVIRGGHHRYAAAKAVGLRDLLFYAEPANREAIESVIPVQWDDA